MLTVVDEMQRVEGEEHVDLVADGVHGSQRPMRLFV